MSHAGSTKLIQARKQHKAGCFLQRIGTGLVCRLAGATRETLLACMAAVAMLAFLAAPAAATSVALVDGNSQVTVTFDGQAGINAWQVDGVNHLNQQWFWYRVGNGPEKSLDTMFLQYQFQSYANTWTAAYIDPLSGLSVSVYLRLTGSPAGGGSSQLFTDIAVTAGLNVNVNFFQYADFDLNGNPGGDTVAFLPGQTVQQHDGNTGLSVIMGPLTPHKLPSGHEAALYSQTRTGLNDLVATNLNGVSGPLTGDVTWALQWDVPLPQGQPAYFRTTQTIMPETQTIVPEPVTMLGVFGAVAGIGAYLRRRGKTTQS